MKKDGRLLNIKLIPNAHEHFFLTSGQQKPALNQADKITFYQ